MTANLKHKVPTIFRAISAWIERGGARISRGVGTTGDFVERLFGGARSRRALFQSVPKGRVSGMRRPQSDRPLDTKRRAFLKYAVFGGVVFLTGKYFGPLLDTLRGDTVLSEKTFDNFKMVETGRQLQITDDDGNEILTIDKEGF